MILRILLLLGFLAHAAAASGAAAPSVGSTRPTTAVQGDSADEHLAPGASTLKAQAGDTVLAVLRERNRLLESHNAQLLATVQWAVGFAAVFLLAFLGLVGFLTNRRYQQDKEALELILTTHSDELRQEITRAHADMTQDITTRTESLSEEVGSAAQAAAKREVTKITPKLTSVEHELESIQERLLEVHAHLWELRGTNANALPLWVGIGETASRKGDKHRISEVLEELDRLFKAGAAIYLPDDTRRISSFLADLPDEFAPLVGRVRAHLDR